MSNDLQLAELMAARLCHDLVGPIGAVASIFSTTLVLPALPGDM